MKSLKKLFSFGQFLSEKMVGNEKLLENKVYTELKNMESNAFLFGLEKESTQLIGSLLFCVVSEKASVYKQNEKKSLQVIQETFL